jgi:hypothetical protein
MEGFSTINLDAVAGGLAVIIFVAGLLMMFTNLFTNKKQP